MAIIDIIIPQYLENEEKLINQFNSLNEQINIDYSKVNIIMVNDGSNVKISDNFFKAYPNLNVSYIQSEENKGPGVTRQLGIDNSNSPYIMFMDAGDILANNICLYILLGCINDISPEAIYCDFIMEDEGGNQITHKCNDIDAFLHGKVFSRSFLKKNGIKFSNKLRVFEDSYFITLVNASSPKIQFLEFPAYVWIYDSNSITRKEDNTYFEKHFNDFINYPFLAYNRLKKINPTFANSNIIKAIFAIICFYEASFNLEGQRRLKERYHKDIFKKINSVLEVFDKYTNKKIYSICREEAQYINKTHPEINTKIDIIKIIDTVKNSN